MEKNHKQALKKSFSYLVNNLQNVASVLDHLINEGVIDNGIKDSIEKEKPVPTAQTRKLLDVLPRRGLKAYNSFINGLIETGNSELAEYVKKQEYMLENPGVAVDDKKSADTQVSTVKYSENTEQTSKLETSNETCKDWPDLSKGLCKLQKMTKPDNIEENNRKLRKEHKVYSIRESGKGLSLLLTNRHGDTPQKFTSQMDYDATRLQKLFKTCLEFDMKHISSNKNREEVKKSLQTQLEEISKGLKYSCLVMVILSCGKDYEPGKVYDKNGQLLPTNEILDIIRSSPAFEGKPKVIIIQTYNCSEVTTSIDSLDSEMSKLTLEKDPNNDDLFVVSSYPTSELGPWMAGDKVDGSYFIQALIDVIGNNVFTMSFLNMMSEVSKNLSKALVPLPTDQAQKENVVRRHVGNVVVKEHCIDKELFFFC